ncbi:hypothetical protein E3N88_27769 [Mikania micrantha]|uniref:Uncharacterized protein n=1 Tax=Mikania micrantha TaxID=192012 RepID=A0A5N6MXP2_9ASTR|nr:hypothetical protein E3N88_27769 [Mikania micrantha]
MWWDGGWAGDVMESMLWDETLNYHQEAQEFVEETIEMEVELPMIKEEVLVNEVEHQSLPVGKIEDGTPLKFTEPREKTTKRKAVDLNRLKKRRTKPAWFVHSHSHHYLLRISHSTSLPITQPALLRILSLLTPENHNHTQSKHVLDP